MEKLSDDIALFAINTGDLYPKHMNAARLDLEAPAETIPSFRWNPRAREAARLYMQMRGNDENRTVTLAVLNSVAAYLSDYYTRHLAETEAQQMAWIIENAEGLAWSNTDGWTDGDNYDTFDETERETLSLPIGGVWVSVPWRKAN